MLKHGHNYATSLVGFVVGFFFFIFVYFFVCVCKKKNRKIWVLSYGVFWGVTNVCCHFYFYFYFFLLLINWQGFVLLLGAKKPIFFNFLIFFAIVIQKTVVFCYFFVCLGLVAKRRHLILGVTKVNKIVSRYLRIKSHES